MQSTLPDGSLKTFHRATRAAIAAAAVLLAPTLVSGQDPGAEPPERPAPRGYDVMANGWLVEGYLDLRYRFRRQASEGVSDSDLFLSGAVDATLKDEVGSDVLRAHFDGLLSADLDGFGPSNEAFSGLQETRNKRTHGYVYGAWVESDTLLSDTSLRLGRQEIAREDLLYFDGLRVDHSLGSNFSLLAYGGVPVHFYESSRGGDALVGAGGRWQANRRFTLELDEIFVREESRPFGASTPQEARNRLTVLSASYLASDAIRVQGSASWVGDQDRRQRLAAHFVSPDGSGWSARVDLRRQNDYGETLVTDLSPYVAVLGDIAPYWNLLAQVNKELWEQIDLGGGFQGRYLEESADEGTYNREFQRYYGTLTVRDFPVRDIDLGTRGDLWDASGSDRISSAGFFASWEWAERARLEAGTDFALYRFDILTGQEKISDRQYYVRARIPVADRYDIGVRYAIDRSKFGTDHEFDFGVGVEF